MTSTPAPTTPAPTTPTYTKIFCGNLSFKTKSQELAAQFSAIGKVVDAKIIARGPRSLGYGFVDMEDEEEANKAVSVMNKKNVDGREINVELAKPRDEAKIAERNEKRRQIRQERNSQKQSSSSSQDASSSSSENNENNNENNTDSAPRRGRGGRGRGGRGRGGRGRGGSRGGRRPRAEDSESDAASASAPSDNNNNNSVAPVEGQAPRAKSATVRRRAPRTFNNNNNNNNNGDNNQQDNSVNNNNNNQQSRPRTRRPRNNSASPANGENRAPRQRRPERRNNLADRQPSEASLFVANLPFAVDDKALEDLFSAYNVKKANVVLNRGLRSKGFGFVELASKEDQQKANEEMNEKEVNGRKLIVRIALAPIENAAPKAEATN